jgi:LDH2 family malate/lactate/ureidoglycolate dehydrogenase
MIASLITGGMASHEIDREPDKNGASQIFMAIDLPRIAGDRADAVVEAIITDLHDADGDPRYPGQGMWRTREEAMSRGVPIEDEHWAHLQSI